MNENLQTLIEQLRDPNRNVRSKAIFALDAYPADQLVTIFMDALETEADFFVREDIIWSLARLGQRVVNPLIALLKNPKPELRQHAAHALGKIAHPAALEPLIETMLQDENNLVVQRVIGAMGQIRDANAVPALIILLGHEDPEVKTALLRVLALFGEASLPGLLASLADENPLIREQAADALGLIADESTAPALMDLVNDPVWEVRFAAATALSYISQDALAQVLPNIQQDEHPLVRGLAQRLAEAL